MHPYTPFYFFKYFGPFYFRDSGQAASFMGLVLLLSLVLLLQLLTGTVSLRGGKRLTRKDNPFGYWSFFLMLAGLIGFAFYTATHP